MKKIIIIKTGTTLDSLKIKKGDFEDWIIAGLNIKKENFIIINACNNEKLPHYSEIKGAIITGSHAMITEHKDWSEKIAYWIKEAVNHIPILGICYGHQLLAYALGGIVGNNPKGKEFGMVALYIKEAGFNTLLFKNFPPLIKVYESHTQSVLKLPDKAICLASTDMDENQAFLYGKFTFGIQFHPEFDKEIMKAYIEHERENLIKEGKNPDKLIEILEENQFGNEILKRFGKFFLTRSYPMKLLNIILKILIIFFLFFISIVYAQSPGKIKVGMVFDVGGRGDKSFNDSAYRGLEKAKKELGIEYKYIEPTQTADREVGLRGLAEKGYSLIIGVGFLFSDAITTVANEFPDTKFACIDYDVIPNKEIPKNLVAIKFKEEEGAFLIGVIAASVSKMNKIGFVGGMDIPLIHKFHAGYIAGAKSVKPNIEVLVNYAGVTPEAFKDPAKGKELALSQYNNGADIIFHASGSTGLGVFQAAKEKGKLAIGVDSDQYSEAPGNILTSMIKKVDVTVFDIIKETIEGKFQSGVRVFSLKDDGIGYVYDEHNKDLIPKSVIDKVEEMKKKIIDGVIKVPDSISKK